MKMAAGVHGTWQTMAIRALRAVLVLIFLAVGITKLTGTGNTVEYFTAIGWGQWFRYLTGLLDIAGSVLLIVPRCASYGAIVLAGSAGLATLISLTVLRGNPMWGDSVMVLVPLALTLLAAAVAWPTYPLTLKKL
jgi:putative oxidoreductase